MRNPLGPYTPGWPFSPNHVYLRRGQQTSNPSRLWQHAHQVLATLPFATRYPSPVDHALQYITRLHITIFNNLHPLRIMPAAISSLCGVQPSVLLGQLVAFSISPDRTASNFRKSNHNVARQLCSLKPGKYIGMVNSSFVVGQGRHEIDICLIGLTPPTVELLKDSEEMNPKYLKRGVEGCCVPIGSAPVEDLPQSKRTPLSGSKAFPWPVRFKEVNI